MKQTAKQIVALTMTIAGIVLMIGSVGTMDYNAMQGLTDKPIVYKMAIAGVILLMMGAYYGHVLAVRLEKYGRC